MRLRQCVLYTIALVLLLFVCLAAPSCSAASSQSVTATSAAALASPAESESTSRCVLHDGGQAPDCGGDHVRSNDLSEGRLGTTGGMNVRRLHPVFGAEVTGVSVGDIAASAELSEQFRMLIHRHRVVRVRSRTTVTPEDQLALSRRLGKIESTFYKHKDSPHPDIFRVSNDERVGCTNVGRSGWHVDGTFLPQPFAYQSMHFPAASRGGFTEFVPLAELLHAQSDAVQAEWRGLGFVVRSSQLVHPLVYDHPVTGNHTLLFHLGAPFCGGWVDSQRRVHPPHKYIDALQRAIDAAREPVWSPSGQTHNDTADVAPSSASVQDEPNARVPLVLAMEWEANDFAVLDNMAVAHYATPETQSDPSVAGLRILHRTTMLLDGSEAAAVHAFSQQQQQQRSDGTRGA